MLIDEVLIVIATTYSYNVYNQERLPRKGKKRVGHFYPLKAPHKIIIENVDLPGINFAKWNKVIRENSNYAHYLLLHDDCFDFQRGWLECMVDKLKTDPMIGCVCNQVYGSSEASYAYYMDCLNNRVDCMNHDQLGNEGFQRWCIDKLKLKFSNPIYNSVAGGEQVLVSNKVMKEIMAVGGIPVPEVHGESPAYERLFSGYFTSLGYKIADCRVNKLPPFQHNVELRVI